MKQLPLALFLLSASLIASQITLMSVLSFVQWYHFAGLIISIALLGFGMAGTFLSLTRRWCLERSHALVPAAMLVSGITLPLAVILSQIPPARFDVFRLFLDLPNIVPLLLTYALFTIPFFFGGLAIGIVFVQHTSLIGRLYFANLSGSAAGAVCALGLAWVFPPQQLLPLLAFLPVTAAVVLSLRPVRPMMVISSAGASLWLFLLLLDAPSLMLSEYKALSKALNLPSAYVESVRPSPYGLVHVVSSPSLRSAPGLSLEYRGIVPPQAAVYSNGDWVGSVFSPVHDDAASLFNYTTMMVPFLVTEGRDMLVLEAGTGMQIQQAVSNGSTRAVAVDPHRTIVSLLTTDLSAFNDSLFLTPGIHAVGLDARTFLLRDTGRYDIISLPLLGSFGGTSGLFALQERFVLTQEAFDEMWEHLDSGGVLTVSAWLDHPPRVPLRLLATIVATLEGRGIRDVSSHLIAVKSWGTMTIVAGNTPFGEPELDKVREFCEDNSFDLLLPSFNKDVSDRFNRMTDTLFSTSIDRILSPARGKFFEEYPFRVTPATDTRPYFDQFLKWTHIGTALSLVGDTGLPFLEMGSILLLISALQVVFLAVILILLPLIRLRREPATSSTILYFSSLGIGYMFVEILFIQQFTLYWGHSVVAASIVLSSMLAASGAGSYSSSTILQTARGRRRTGVVVGLLLGTFAFLLPLVVRSTIDFPEGAKAIVTLLLIGPPSYFMGMMFPSGLRALERESEMQVPWAWGINGTMSVVGGSLSVPLLVEFGSTTAFLAAGLCYVAAAVAARK